MSRADINLAALAQSLRQSRSFAAKADIACVVKALGIETGAIAVGDDCAAIPDGDV